MHLHTADAPARRYPTARSGGLFLGLMGLTCVAATLSGGGEGLRPAVFVLGTAAAVFVGLVLLRRRLATGEQTREQRLIVVGALALEAAMAVAVVHWFGHGDPRTLWLLLLLAVGVHFLPFGLVHGPKAALLGLLCSANALLGLWLLAVPFPVFGVTDGLLKLAIGSLLFAGTPHRRSEPVFAPAA